MAHRRTAKVVLFTGGASKQGRVATLRCAQEGAKVAGLIGTSNIGHAYHASKGGAIALPRAMALTDARQNVRVNAICPSTLETPMPDAIC